MPVPGSVFRVAEYLRLVTAASSRSRIHLAAARSGIRPAAFTLCGRPTESMRIVWDDVASCGRCITRYGDEDEIVLHPSRTRDVAISGQSVTPVSTVTEVALYTDGACLGNPGPGGWAAILVAGGKERELSGYEEQTTNNRQELLAAINGLRALKRRCRVTITTDSEYVANGFRKRWIETWKRHGWRNSDREPVKNRDLWEKLEAEITKHDVHWVSVRGHTGHPYNERCHRLAGAAAEAASTETRHPSDRPGGGR